VLDGTRADTGSEQLLTVHEPFLALSDPSDLAVALCANSLGYPNQRSDWRRRLVGSWSEPKNPVDAPIASSGFLGPCSGPKNPGHRRIAARRVMGRFESLHLGRVWTG
jgi:hypothetical protein